MKEFKCSIYRGGTSKGVCFLEYDLPKKELWTDFLCEVMGGETKQIDGLGGGVSVTSKVAIISKGKNCINYTFAQVAVDKHIVDFKSNCGNISSIVGPFAYDSGLISEDMLFKDECDEDHICIRIYNTNTSKFIKSRFAIKGSEFNPNGKHKIAGVPGAASKIELSFLEPQSSLGRGLLPTNNELQTIQTSFGEIEISIVDAGAPLVFMRSKDLLIKGIYDEISQNELEKIEEVRGIASELLGLASRKEAVFKNPAIPKAALVDFSQDYINMSKDNIKKNESNIAVRMMSMQKPHPAIAITGTVCIGMASLIQNSLVAKHLKNFDGKNLKIAHPSGIIECKVSHDFVQITRTARRILKGIVFTKQDF
ncbi:PrpF domain-containing protein [Campylobacter jejuni]|uniref:PrpF domain-containing protein n=1 Tax=Campylobacter jejuni TaxID=197 RepID=UPI000F8140CD|nr:PrpF domain-containing protein [Campylobacter jejuni]RTI73805.1 3-methylitaconate isomerase [Campylobacter jejuni]RTI83559.1 3-methylitaconate isomerase [Campylobacter jejuni]